jgi:hypothetical protein
LICFFWLTGFIKLQENGRIMTIKGLIWLTGSIFDPINTKWNIL